MKRDALYKIVDTILNHATEDDLEVIEAALQRRYGEEEENNAGAFQFSPRKAADESAHTIADQISYSKSTIRNMIKNFAVDIIRKEAPELSDEQIRELLEAWIPDPEGNSSKSESAGSSQGKSDGSSRGGQQENRKSTVPPDMMITMIEQFIEYSEGRLSVRRQAQLRQEMGEWQETYWKWFPPDIREAVSLYLKGTIDKETFWLDVHKCLS